MPELVEVKKFISKPDAELAASFLEGSGITCHVMADDLAGMRPDFSTGFSVRLMVSRDDLDNATEILKSYNHVEIQPAEEIKETKPMFLKKAVFSAILGLSFLPVLPNVYSIYLLFVTLKKEGILENWQKFIWGLTLLVNISFVTILFLFGFDYVRFE